ncbi:MAG: type IX secretion system sortase PorU [Bacteroidetes bacterium]|nr:type IX secretion system sortase PorU [Bacteroidota bacterium]
MKKDIIGGGLALLFLVGVSFGQEKHSVTLMSQGGSTTTIEVIPDSLGADTISTNGEKSLQLVFRGAVPEYNSNGGYMRQFIPVFVGVFSKQIQVQVVQTDYRTEDLMAPPRSPKYPPELKAKVVTQFVGYDGPFDQRKHLVTRLRVYPFTYDSTTGQYHMLSRIVIQVTSSGSGVQTRTMPTDPLLSGLLINYDQVKDAVVGGPSPLYKTEASSVLSQGTWYRMSVTRNGIYKVTYSQLKAAGVPVDNIDMSTIKIYNNGGEMLPENPLAARPDGLMENAIYVSGTGTFGPNDYILFYGRGTKGWNWDTTSNTFSHYINNYSDTNYYFITWGGGAGERMASEPSVHATSYYRPQSFVSGVFQDSSMFNLLESGQQWYGPELQAANAGLNNSTYMYQNKLYGLDPSRRIEYRVALISRSDYGTSNYFDIYENATGVTLGTVQGGTVNFNDDTGLFAYALPVKTYYGTGNLPDDRSVLKIAYSATSASSVGYIDWVEIQYHRYFQSVGDVLNFYAPDTNATEYYSVTGFSSNSVQVFDVSNFANVEKVSPDSVSNGAVYFGTRTTSGTRRQFYAVGANGYLTVARISPVENSNLHGELAGADLIIVTAPQFKQQADELASWKQSHDGLKTLVATTTDIYNEFGCGMPDPTAIRDFLKYEYTNDQLTPSYVILFGSGTYDYKSIAASDTEFVPPYESSESLDQVNTYCTDDYFVQFTAPLMQTPISMVIGRLPARTAQDADAVVGKIEEYESSPQYGSWRNLITFVGDQGVTTGGGNDYSLHTDQADLLAQAYTPGSFDKQKIYLVLYPVVNTTQGRREPQAAAAIVNQVNQGTLVINFVGHGAPNLWSYTHVFENSVTIPQLTNKDKLALWIAATCDFSRDDSPTQLSGGELLVNDPNGGAIGVVSATRVVYSNDNATINQDLFLHLFTQNSQRDPNRIGEALFQAKQGDYQAYSFIKYNYLGDPSVRLGMPQYQAEIDSLNNQSLVQTRFIRALDKVDIEGTVLHPDGTVWNNLTSTGLVTIYDSDQPVYVPLWNRTYLFQGSILFRGQVSITNGEFTAETVIPKDISYSNKQGKIEMYFQGGGSDGLGYTRNVIVGGTDTNAVNNHVPPQISIYFDSKNFRNGDVVSSHPTMIVDLHAVNGLNLSDVAVGHGLEATFDGGQAVKRDPG